jgi:hypothetical protein
MEAQIHLRARPIEEEKLEYCPHGSQNFKTTRLGASGIQFNYLARASIEQLSPIDRSAVSQPLYTFMPVSVQAARKRS